MYNWRLTINQFANANSIHHEGVETILHNELGMAKVSDRLLPRSVTPSQNTTKLRQLFKADLTCFLECTLTQNDY